MNRWFLDASVLLAWEAADDEHRPAAVALIEGADALFTLDLARHEVANVATVAWKDQEAAIRLLQLIDALAEDSGVREATTALLTEASRLAQAHHISVYAASYVAAATAAGSQLVSCDFRDLVSKGLAIFPEDAVAPGPAR